MPSAVALMPLPQLVKRWLDRPVSWPTFVSVIAGTFLGSLTALTVSALRQEELLRRTSTGVDALNAATEQLEVATKEVSQAVVAMDRASYKSQRTALIVAVLSVVVAIVAIIV
ncbi:MAG: hypothetical protein QOJ29_2711 [Thermoleophilaceae bacterium]|jgi:hypothetical protein|nr:hypothetical protein [Thermoleophilaceae bacterium]